MSTITLYGIPNCDQVKKARTWLEQQGRAYSFHDFKKAGLSRETVGRWLAALPWEQLVNRKGTTWRALPDERKQAVKDAASALDLMLEQPSVVKRPVLETGNGIYTGYADDLYQEIFRKES